MYIDTSNENFVFINLWRCSSRRANDLLRLSPNGVGFEMARRRVREKAENELVKRCVVSRPKISKLKIVTAAALGPPE
jgi:hypothetical protein